MFDLILADPPWNWKARSPKGEGRSAKKHYPVMKTKDICALPVAGLGDKDSILFMWVIDTMFRDAFEVMDAWGYRQVTVGFYWAKTLRKSEGWHVGNGYYTRANPEQCWIGRRGKGLTRRDMSVRRLIVAPVGEEHSAKPHEAYTRIERLYGDVRRVELFARNRRPGWEAFGNQVEGSISLLNQ